MVSTNPTIRTAGSGLTLALAMGLAGCAIDGLAARAFEDDPPTVPPPVPNSLLQAQVPAGLAGGTASLYASGAGPLGYEARVGAEGRVEFELPGSESFINQVLVTRRGEQVVLGLLPPLASVRSVHDEGTELTADDVAAFTGRIDELTTARVLLLLASARLQPGGSLAAVHPKLLSATLLGLAQPEQRTESLRQWEQHYSRLALLATADGDGPPVIDPATAALDEAFIQQARAEGPWVDAALEHLATAAAEVEFESCLAPDVQRVVFSVQMAEGMQDGACRPINRFLWAKDGDGKQMYLTGGIHDDYEGLDETEQQQVSDLLGDWVPNLLPMYNDGTHGDAAAGDDVWTLAVDLPRLDPPLQIGYKYTWGLQGQGWTEAEEWPGNRRILELVDENGDGLITRHDRFADEASNKDKSNLHPQARRGVSWDTDLDEAGVPTSHERPVDLDGDCVPDGFPPALVGPALGDPDVTGGCLK